MSTGTIVYDVAETIQNGRKYNIPTSDAVLIAKIENAYFNNGIFNPDNPALKYARDLQQIQRMHQLSNGRFADVQAKTLEVFSKFGRKNHARIIYT